MFVRFLALLMVNVSNVLLVLLKKTRRKGKVHGSTENFSLIDVTILNNRTRMTDPEKGL